MTADSIPENVTPKLNNVIQTAAKAAVDEIKRHEDSWDFPQSIIHSFRPLAYHIIVFTPFKGGDIPEYTAVYNNRFRIYIMVDPQLTAVYSFIAGKMSQNGGSTFNFDNLKDIDPVEIVNQWSGETPQMLFKFDIPKENQDGSVKNV